MSEKLSVNQRKALRDASGPAGCTAYGCSSTTWFSLERRGLVELSRGYGSIDTMHAAITVAGRAALDPGP